MKQHIFYNKSNKSITICQCNYHTFIGNEIWFTGKSPEELLYPENCVAIFKIKLK